MRFTRALLAAALVCLPLAASAQPLPRGPDRLADACQIYFDRTGTTFDPATDTACEAFKELDAEGPGGGGTFDLTTHQIEELQDVTATSGTATTIVTAVGPFLDGTCGIWTGGNLISATCPGGGGPATESAAESLWGVDIRTSADNFDHRVTTPTAAAIQAAIDACPRSYSNRSVGCKIELPGGVIDLPAALTAGGVTTSTVHVGLELHGQGKGRTSVSGGGVGAAGTILRWAGAGGGTMFDCNGCEYLKIKDIGFAMNGGSLASNADDAGVAIKLTATGTSVTGRHPTLENVAISGNSQAPSTTTVGVLFGTSVDQVDNFQITNSDIDDVGIPIQVKSDQSVNNIITSSNIIGRVTGVDLQKGGLSLFTTVVGCRDADCYPYRFGSVVGGSPASMHVINGYHELNNGGLLRMGPSGAGATYNSNGPVYFLGGYIRNQCAGACPTPLIDAAAAASSRIVFSGIYLNSDANPASSYDLVLNRVPLIWERNVYSPNATDLIDQITLTGGATISASLTDPDTGTAFSDRNLNLIHDDDEWEDSPRKDTDGDGLYEWAQPWDADGDGSSIYLCVGLRDPVPQCKVAGERVFADWVDDANCMIHGCGHGQMEVDGEIKQEEIVYAIYPCWDLGAWEADPATPAGCPAAGINDPRDSCGSAARRDSDTGDAAVYASCAVDADGYPLVALATQDWQGTIEGAGTDTRRNDTSLMAARGTGRTVGTTWSIDTGNWDSPWFTQDFTRAIQMSRSRVGTLLSTQGGGSVLSTGSKGWGIVVGEASNVSVYAGPTGSAGYLCVCDSATSCDGQVGQASATDWVDGLVDDDLLTVDFHIHPATGHFMPLDVLVKGAGTTFSQGACPAGAKQVPIGGFAASTRSAAIPIGMAARALGHAAYHVRPSARNARAVIRNVTVESQDWYGEQGGQCSKTGQWITTADAVSRDGDCDTNPIFAFHGWGTNTIERLVGKNWHHYFFDGGPSTGKVITRDTEFWFGHGASFMDDSYGSEFYNTRIYDSEFAGLAASGGFSAYTLYDGLEFHNTNSQGIMSFGYGNVGIQVRNAKMIGAQFTHGFDFLCGAAYNSIENVTVNGRKVTGEGQENSLIRFWCDSEYTTLGECGTLGLVQDRDGGAGDYHCDASAHDNRVHNVIEGPPGGDLPMRNAFTTIDTVAETITLTNPLNYYHCQGPFFVFAPGTALTGNTYYIRNPNYAANTIQLSSASPPDPTCSTPVDLSGTVTGTGQIHSAKIPGQVMAMFRTVDGQERALRNNDLSGLRISTPLAGTRCRAPGVMCEENATTATVLGVWSPDTEEVLGYNDLSDSYADNGALVGTCQATTPDGIECPDIGSLQSFATVRGTGNHVGGKAQRTSRNSLASGKDLVFCGDLPPGADSTWWLPPVSELASYAALVDERVDRLVQPISCASRLGVLENTAAVGTVDEPVTQATPLNDPPLYLSDMTCSITGDALGSVAFQLYIDGAAASGFACTVTAGADFESNCSVAPVVALSTVPASILPDAPVAVGITTSGSNTGNDAYCVVRTRER